jgi:hypothetical protein
LDVIMHIHAGTVIGGTIESRGPQTPFSLNFVRFGMSPAYSSKMWRGGAQSRPMTITRFFFSPEATP